MRARTRGFTALALVGSLILSFTLAAGPGAVPARAATGAGGSTLEISGLKRTNQVLTVLLALLRILDELSLVSGSDGTPPPVPPGPPPSGTGHPGPGPLPVIAPDDSPPALFTARA